MSDAKDDIRLQPYDPMWPTRAADEIARLIAILPHDMIIDIAHHGSTAIVGAMAKPIIDIGITIPSAVAAACVVPLMRSLGYVFWEDNPNRAHLFFVKGMPPYGTARTHHVHMFEDANELRRRVAFRDYLNAHASARQRYEVLKCDLAARFAEDREAYGRGKDAFVAEILALAP